MGLDKKKELQKKLKELEEAAKSGNPEAIKKAIFALKKYLETIGLLNTSGEIALDTLSLLVGGSGPLEGVGNLLGGAGGGYIGFKFGTLLLTKVPGLAAEVPSLPVWTGLAGSYLGKEKLGEWGRVADEFYGFDDLGKAY